MKKKQNKVPNVMPSINTNTQVYNQSWLEKLHTNILSINSSKFFAGIVMITLNMGSKVIPIQFSKSAEEYLKYSLSKILLVFAMAWMGTRDIYTALILTLVFIICSEYLFNEDSLFCIVPHHKRVLESLKDGDNRDSTGGTTTSGSGSGTGIDPLLKKDKIELYYSSGDLEVIKLIENAKNIINANNK